jgi:plasmid maintenance system antidote protein VapI
VTPAQLQKMIDRAGLSQRGLARELGINERHMRRYIAGEAAIPKTVEIAARCICDHRASDSGTGGKK